MKTNKIETINIAFTVNNNYSPYLATCIASILANSKSLNKLSFCILTGDISEENKRKIELLKEIRDFEIEYLIVDKTIFNHFPVHLGKNISCDSNYRLLMASLKPDWDKCIFIDADLVFVGDIIELWDVNIDNYYMAAAIDPGLVNPSKWGQDLLNILKLSEGCSYVNVGVTVFNLKKWREDNVENKFFEDISFYGNALKFPDQDVLNTVLQSAILYLPSNYNAMPAFLIRLDDKEKKTMFDSPLVIHWAGPNKPWFNETILYVDLFWKYAKLTKYYEEIIYSNINKKNEKIKQDIIESLPNIIENEIYKYENNKKSFYSRKYKLFGITIVTTLKSKEKYRCEFFKIPLLYVHKGAITTTYFSFGLPIYRKRIDKNSINKKIFNIIELIYQK